MSRFHFQYIETWKEDDLLLIPEAETDQYEYKSSVTPDDELGKKISVAASALWNSGGGIFIAGVNNDGKIDGGITSKVGRQSRRDWFDRQISKTEPPGKYWINTIIPDSSNSPIKPDHVVIVIGFEESIVGPHMAYDKKYYLRLGAHSEPATHFLVEAIRAKRAIRTPILRAILRRSDRKSHIIELAIIVLNDAAALNVEIIFDPLPKLLDLHFSDRFPLKIPVIDHTHPFSMEFYWWGERSQTFGENSVELRLNYEDILENSLSYTQTINVLNSIAPMQIGNTDLGEIEKVLRDISLKIDNLNPKS